jgi:DNA primase
MGFPGAFLDEITVKTDMIALVSQYTRLSRKGARWFAVCPFHSEKTPSFVITPETGLFYCFGCQAGGGPIQFVMRAENLEFSDAVRQLAERLGLSVPEDGSEQGFRVKRERLIEINRMAARWFYERLGSEEGAVCAEYMRSRGMHPHMARKFGLGYAPNRWDGLFMALSEAGVSNDEMSAAGLVSRNQRGGLYDSFRDRLMFPIFDLRGQVAGFSGRALGDGTPKYKNTAESYLYQKRSLLYGANLARKSERPYWILCEGNADVFILHQAGFDNTVATCGTALTDAQARIAARHVKEVFIAYDADTAGQNATQKAVGILEAAGVKVRVLHMRGAKDPDDFIRAYGAEAFEKLIADSQNHIEYQLSLLEGQISLDTVAGKQEFLKKALPLLAELPTEGERLLYSGKVGSKLGIDGKAVAEDVKAACRKRGKSAEKAFQKQILRPREAKTAKQAAEEQVLALLLRMPELETSLTADDFSSENLARLFENLAKPDYEETVSLRAELLTRYTETVNSEQVLRDCEARIKNPKSRMSHYRNRTEEEGDGL